MTGIEAAVAAEADKLLTGKSQSSKRASNQGKNMKANWLH